MATVHPRKRRTREHVIASMSINYVERFIIDAGHTVQRIEADYGFDLVMTTFDERGYLEAGRVVIQCKASDHLPDPRIVDHVSFRLDVRDFNLWLIETIPVFVFLFDAKRKHAYWIHFQEYARQEYGLHNKITTRTVLLRFPVTNRMNARTVGYMRRCKSQPTLLLRRP